MTLDVVELKSTDELEHLRPEWLSLFQRCPAATPFQSPAWLLPWWRYFGGSELLALAVRASGELVGFAPFFIWNDPPARKVVPVGAGVTDYLDVLFLPGHEQVGCAAMFDYLAGVGRRWDLVWSPDLRDGSVLLATEKPHGWTDERAVTEYCPVLALSDRVDGVAAAVPESKLRKLRYYRRRTDKLGGIAVEQAVPKNLDELFAAMVDLHAAEWRARGQAGMLADPAVLAFHRDVSTAMLGDGMLRLYGFRLGGRLVASLYAFAANRLSCVYLGAYDPSLAQLGLGTLSVGTAIEMAAAEGAREFHFLRGREQHKYSWGATDRASWSRTLRWGQAADLSN